MAKETIGIIGGGSWGTALAHLAALAGSETILWMRDAGAAEEFMRTGRNMKYWPDYPLAEGITATSDMRDVAARAKLLIVVVPSGGLRDVARELGDCVAGDHIILNAAKGIEPVTGARMMEILRDETPAKRTGVLSGPNLAEEILMGQPSATVVASRFPEVVKRFQDALSSPRFRVYGNADPVGVEIAGALKNIVAICAGMIDGMGYGANTMSMVITRGAAEIKRFGVTLGADEETFAGLSGIGDLITTCSSRLSRNHKVGYRLSKGEKLQDILTSLKRTAEGVNTTKVVHSAAARLGVDMPITEGVHAILYENTSAEDVIRFLMTRSAKYEVDSSGNG